MLHPLEEMASEYRRDLVSSVLFDLGRNLESKGGTIMLVTKEEAGKKYCPFKFSRNKSKEVKGINTEWMCEGLNCMMWRRKTAPPGREHGFCGLAGIPSVERT
jgi:hypothetical protein